MLLRANIGVAQNVHPFRISGHDAILDPIVDHLDEVAGAVAAAAQVTELGGAADLLASGRARDVACAGRERLKDRIEALHGSFRPADHHAITALQAPDAATGSDIHIIDAFGCERVGAQDVVDVVGVTAVDEDVASFEVRYDL